MDFWNFTLLVQKLDDDFSTDWRKLGPVLTRAAEDLLDSQGGCCFEGLHVVGSYDPSNRQDDTFKHWFLNKLPTFPGVEQVLLPRQKRRKPPACPTCHKGIPVCPDCKSDMRKSEEKGVDTRLATDLIRLAWAKSYDVAVLVSADKDFVPVVEFLMSRGLKIIHGSFPKSGNQISNACWGRLDMEALMPRFKRPSPRPRRH